MYYVFWGNFLTDTFCRFSYNYNYNLNNYNLMLRQITELFLLLNNG